MTDELDAEHAPDQLQALWDPDAFRADPRVGFTAAELPLTPSFALTAIDEGLDRSMREDPLGGSLTWWAGRPVGLRSAPRPWPRNADGEPLAHVLQVGLSSQRLNHRPRVFDETGLPGDGILQVFHDLHTYGGEHDDHADDLESQARGWQIRWTPFEEGQSSGDRADLELVAPPGDLDPDRLDQMRSLNSEVFATTPSPLDLPDDFDRADDYARVHDWLEEHPHWRNPMAPEGSVGELTPWQTGYEPCLPTTRLLGHGFVETNPDYEADLAVRLPVVGDDRRVLLAELNPHQFDSPTDWFHGHRPVQVWIRVTDLATRRFDRAWCLIRTDAFGG